MIVHATAITATDAAITTMGTTTLVVPSLLDEPLELARFTPVAAALALLRDAPRVAAARLACACALDCDAAAADSRLSAAAAIEADADAAAELALVAEAAAPDAAACTGDAPLLPWFDPLLPALLPVLPALELPPFVAGRFWLALLLLVLVLVLPPLLLVVLPLLALLVWPDEGRLAGAEVDDAAGAGAGALLDDPPPLLLLLDAGREVVAGAGALDELADGGCPPPVVWFARVRGNGERDWGMGWETGLGMGWGGSPRSKESERGGREEGRRERMWGEDVGEMGGRGKEIITSAENITDKSTTKIVQTVFCFVEVCGDRPYLRGRRVGFRSKGWFLRRSSGQEKSARGKDLGRRVRKEREVEIEEREEMEGYWMGEGKGRNGNEGKSAMRKGRG
ncbi:hypothetical protein L1887_58667 [Cichorium endivia]|nr:hypothetical protein L1887_58667 [Cichorium endivia]